MKIVDKRHEIVDRVVFCGEFYKLTTGGSSKSGFRRKRAILIDFWRKRAFSSTFFTFSKSWNIKFGKNVDKNAKFRQNSIENYSFLTFFRGVNFRRPYLPRFETVFDADFTDL